MAADGQTVMVENRSIRIDGAFLWKILKRNAGLICLLAVILGCAVGAARYVGTTPRYTVEICFIVQTVRAVQGSESNECRVVTDSSDVNGASAMAQSILALLREDLAAESILALLETNAYTKEDLRGMLSISADGQTVTVLAIGEDRERAIALAKAVETAVPTVVNFYFGVDAEDGAGSTGCVAVSLSRIHENGADILVTREGRGLLLFTVMGAVSGAAVAYFAAFAKAFYDGVIRTSEDLKRCYTLTVMGQVPPLRSIKRRGGSTERHTDVRGGTHTPASERVWLHTDAPAEWAVPFERIRTHLQRFSSGECGVIGFTSDRRGTGTSVTAAYTAIAFARMNKRVLLIDGNLRHPGQHIRFGRDKVSNGLSEMLAGRCPKEAVCIRAERPRYPDLVVCGQITADPSELLASESMGAFLNYARKQYDIVLIDLPSLDEAGDAVIPADHIDGYVLVVRAGVSHVDSLDFACEALGKAGVPTEGFVLTEEL